MKLADNYPVEYLKIDSSLIANLHRDEEAVASLVSIVEIAQTSGKLTIAESLEDLRSLMVLFQCGVDFAQGCYIQEPSARLDFDFSQTLEERTHQEFI
jgi:EAL domain-containing protein (putative c-di-GMP-specific phosphodiesterase class I)